MAAVGRARAALARQAVRLTSLGNTCYLNAAVQILRRMKINGFQPRCPDDKINEAERMTNAVLANVANAAIKEEIKQDGRQFDSIEVIDAVLQKNNIYCFLQTTEIKEPEGVWRVQPTDFVSVARLTYYVDGKNEVAWKDVYMNKLIPKLYC